MQKILLLALLAQSAGVGNKTIDASVHQKGANPLAFLVASCTPTTTIACNVADPPCGKPNCGKPNYCRESVHVILRN
jgi:hypothetical protein